MTTKEQCELIFRKLPTKKQWRVARKMANGHELACIRGFLLIDGSKLPSKPIPTVVFHVAGGLWRGYDINFAEFVEYLNTHTERDEELISDIYGIE